MTTVVTETVPLPDTKIKKNKKDKKDSKKKKEEKAQIVEDRFKPVENPLFSLEEPKRSIILAQTPTELQGFAAQRYIPSSSYAHLDPAKHENAHSAFKQLQKLVNTHQLTSKPSNNNPERLADGAIVLEYCQAHWDYKAQIASEISFLANDRLAILNRQPDGWWFAELLDPKRRKRGLIPCNYVTPISN